MINKYSIVNGAKYFSSGRLQNYIVAVLTRHVGFLANDGKICFWKFTWTSKKGIKNPQTSDISLTPDLINGYPIKSVKLKGIWLKQECLFLFMEIKFIYFL